MIKKTVLLVVCIVLVLSTLMLSVNVAYACADCSPGFWKNHTEIWYEDFDAATAAAMLAGLQGGYATRESRFEITAQLNEIYWWANCDD